jgi:deoxyuridine 5'-triphosphate nucleotidohydrolase
MESFLKIDEFDIYNKIANNCELISSSIFEKDNDFYFSSNFFENSHEELKDNQNDKQKISKKQLFWILRSLFDNSRRCRVFQKTLFNNNLIVDVNLSAITSNKNILLFFKKVCEKYEIFFSNYEEEDLLVFKSINALELLHNLYNNADQRCVKEENFHQYCLWITGNNGNLKIPTCKFLKHDKNAVIPSKHRISDVGYDLTIIKLVKKLGEKTFMYDTCISVQPEFGYYTKIVPRSSLVKSGYMLSNSIGIIDPGYTGTLKIVLTRVDESIPELTLPFKCCQLIIDRNIHYELEEETEYAFDTTSRSSGGFGSTNSKN